VSVFNAGQCSDVSIPIAGRCLVCVCLPLIMVDARYVSIANAGQCLVCVCLPLIMVDARCVSILIAGRCLVCVHP